MTEAPTREVTIGSDASRLPTGLRPGSAALAEATRCLEAARCRSYLCRMPDGKISCPCA